MEKIVKTGFIKEVLEKETNIYVQNKEELCAVCTTKVQIKYIAQANFYIELDLMGYYGQYNCTLATIPTNSIVYGNK